MYSLFNIETWDSSLFVKTRIQNSNDLNRKNIEYNTAGFKYEVFLLVIHIKFRFRVRALFQISKMPLYIKKIYGKHFSDLKTDEILRIFFLIATCILWISFYFFIFSLNRIDNAVDLYAGIFYWIKIEKIT